MNRTPPHLRGTRGPDRRPLGRARAALATLACLLPFGSGCAVLAPTPFAALRPPAQEASGDETPVESRVRADYDAAARDFPVTSFNPNYLLLYTYNDGLDTSTLEQTDPSAANLRNEEVKFQVSVKFPLWHNMLGESNDLYFAYTQVAWWQLYTSQGRLSAPFRETNYEPELFLRHYGGPQLPWGGEVGGFDIGVNHQSNGQSEPSSRSWNRVMGRVALDYGDLAFLGRLWWRIPEDEEDDDNPNEYRYLGYGDLRAVWTPNRNTLTAMVRPGTEEAGYELTWSYPITKALRFYAQWYYGYGESLLDYDQRTNRIGVGVALSDYLGRED